MKLIVAILAIASIAHAADVNCTTLNVTTVSVGLGAPPEDIDTSGYTLVFEDNFDTLSVSGADDKGGATWRSGMPTGAAGNFSVSTWDIAALTIPTPGILQIGMYNVAGTWYSGCMTTMDKLGNGFGLQYGYFEVRAKMPNAGQGAWPAFWILSETAIPNNTGIRLEVDILEWYGNNQQQNQLAIHYWNNDGSQASGSQASFVDIPNNDSINQWHIYGALVTPSTIQWYIDGVAVGGVSTNTTYSQSDHFIVLNYAAGGGWPLTGVPFNTNGSSAMLVDWVRAWALPAAGTFSYTMPNTTRTSAGVFDSSGTLVKTLWQDVVKNAGVNTATWDGTDNFGATVAAGTYDWKVIVNNSTYENVTAVGNDGIPQDTTGHTPFYQEGLDVDSSGVPYRVHDWNEPHYDVDRLSTTTGQRTMTSMQTLQFYLLKGIAVEPTADGSGNQWAYCTAYKFDTPGIGEFVIFRINMKPGMDRNDRQVAFTTAGEHIVQYAAGTYDDPVKGEADYDIKVVPNISIDIYGADIYVTDSGAGKISVYNRTTGAFVRQITGLPLACGIVINQSNGDIWVGHEYTKISRLNNAGTVQGTTTLAAGTEVRALSMNGSTLAVADRHNWIKKYSVSGSTLTELDSYGLPFRPGDKDPERVREIFGMAMDSSNNIYFTDRLGNAARTQKIDSSMNPVWQQLATENTSALSFHTDNPDFVISGFKNIYSRDGEDFTFEGIGRTEPFLPKSYMGNWEVGHVGPPKLIKLNSDYFWYFFAGESIGIYKVAPPPSGDRTNILNLVGILGNGSSPQPNGQFVEPTWDRANRYIWSWNDNEGDNAVDYTSISTPNEVTLDAYPIALGFPPSPEWEFVVRSASVDDAGTLWIAAPSKQHYPIPGYEDTGQVIYKLPIEGFNSLGNPVYHWNDMVKVINTPTPRAFLGSSVVSGDEFEWMQGVRSDGLLYGLSYINDGDTATRWVARGGSWMAGNCLWGFDPTTAAIKFGVETEVPMIGIAPIPGGGFFTSSNEEINGTHRPGVIHHFSKYGLRLATFYVDSQFGVVNVPNDSVQPVGGMDAFLAIACNRDPRDGDLRLSQEDNFNQRILWYVVDDNLAELTGTVVRP